MAEKTRAQESIVLEQIQPGIMVMRFVSLERDPLFSAQQAELLEKRILDLYTVNPGVIFDYLVDASRVSEANFISVPARRIYKRAYSLPQTGRVAYVGLGRWLKLMTRIFAHVLNRHDRTRWFTTEADGLAWLKQHRSS